MTRNGQMCINITPEITAWIEECRKTMANSPAEFQSPFDPGFQQVMDAYDKTNQRQLVGDMVILTGGRHPGAYEGLAFYVTSVEPNGNLTLTRSNNQQKPNIPLTDCWLNVDLVLVCPSWARLTVQSLFVFAQGMTPKRLSLGRRPTPKTKSANQVKS